jgi:Tol biopolymer transport system component
MTPLTRRIPWTLAAPLLLLACGPDTNVVDPPARADVASAAEAGFGEWSAPVNLGPIVNSTANEVGSEISRDGLSLYFASNRAGGLGFNDIYVAQRTSLDAPWGPPVSLGPTINSAFGDAGPHLSRDGHYLYFTSARLTGQAGNEIYVSYRADVHDDLAWGSPGMLAYPPNSTEFSELGPNIWGSELYFWRGPNNAQSLPGDIWVSDIRGGTFDEPRLVAELSSEYHDEKPAVRFDGREIYISSDRPGGYGLTDVWLSHRAVDGRTWLPPVNAGPVINSAASDRAPSLAGDGTILVFYSTRPGGVGGADLYLSTRTRSGPRD